MKDVRGYSQVFSWVFLKEQEIVGFALIKDEEYSDMSGYETIVHDSFVLDQRYFSATKSSDSLVIYRHKYTDTNNYYYAINWDEKLTGVERTTLLKDFLNKFRYTKAFDNIDKKLFYNCFAHVSDNRYETIKEFWNKNF